ncbi:hypothetical protein [Acinetobacter guillouiae]|nr:hypothetical protein [Acinetobacter guillouiae]
MYDWNLCLAKDGYITQEFVDVGKKAQIKIILKKGETPLKQ